MTAPLQQPSSSLTAIILTFNEQKHIARCIESVRALCERVVVIDSYSTDETCEVARSLGAEVLQRTWPNDHSNQINWGLKNAKITTPWTLRLDADEYLTPELATEIAEHLPRTPNEVSAYLLPRLVYFKGHAVRHGGFYPQWLLRVWRTGVGRSESRLMDEHIVVASGRVERFKNDLVDENLNDVTWWSKKHLNYARREAAAMILDELNDTKSPSTERGSPQAARKRWIKQNVYRRLPLGARAVSYFGYRFGLKLGVLDHPDVWSFHFLQGLWYRLLVDLNLKEFRDAVGQSSVEERLDYLRQHWKLEV